MGILLLLSPRNIAVRRANPELSYLNGVQNPRISFGAERLSRASGKMPDGLS
jgi:hypothetical protein